MRAARNDRARRRTGACSVATLLIGLGLCARCAQAADADSNGATTNPDMAGAYGPYAMFREASGTSWQPDNAPMEGLHEEAGPWTWMAHGNLTGVYTDQSGPRGETQAFNESMLMVMGRRQIGADALSVRLMGSLEPLDGPRGYPLLLQTGETANGTDPLIDRQHPHNLLMELAASYSKTLSDTGSVFIYGGPVGEPALGPPAYMHRASSEDNPDAPLTHHWLDSTHVTFGVVTVGAVWGRWKLEASSFNGREPDEHRYSVQFRALDSYSMRVSYNPADALSFQVSAGRLASPEQLEPDTSVRRTTGSVIYDRPVGSAHWQSTLAWGRNVPSAGRSTDGYLLDSALRLSSGHTVFVRVEHVIKDELFAAGDALYGQAFLIQKASVGYVFDFAERRHLRFGIGGLVSRFSIPANLDYSYGSEPAGYTVFVRARLVP